MKSEKKLDDAGLITWPIGSKIGKIDITDDFSKHLEVYKNTLEVANVLGAKNIRLFSFYIPEDKEPEIFKNEVIDRIGQILEIAEGADINICHENEKGIYGDNWERCLELYKIFPTLKGIFDPANYVQCGISTLEVWENLKQYIHYMHIKDALKDGYIVPAGKGDGNIKTIAKDFIALGGKHFTMEPHLTVFEGLQSHERAGEKSLIGKFEYESKEQAFDIACKTFKSLLEE